MMKAINAVACLCVAIATQYLFFAAFLSALPTVVVADGDTKPNPNHNTCTSSTDANPVREECIVHNDENNHRVYVYREDNINQLYDKALSIFLRVVQDNPKAVILLPTGSTPKLFYKKLIVAFEQMNDPKQLDLSQITLFNLDEYVGLPADHPLSYHWFMEKNLYGPLRSIDTNRAPRKENIHVPTTTDNDGADNPETSIQQYGNLLHDAISANGGHLDLAILGVGGAYPVRNKTNNGSADIIMGGHVAFNEPGSDVTQSAHLVQLTEKTRDDTAYRFKSLANLIRSGELLTIIDSSDQSSSLSTEVPTHAMTLGLADIVQADTILVLATGDEKAPALQKAFTSPNNSDIPVSHLVGNPNVIWMLDESAARTLQTYDYLSIPEKLPELVKNAVATTDQFFPKGENVLILSPHPDDDVISMGASIVYLRQRGCTVHVAYAVTGSNAVRPEGSLYEEGLQRAMESSEVELALAELSDGIEASAKAWVRGKEATRATSLLGVFPENLNFLECEYYNRRGVEGVNAITDNDLRKMVNVITSSSPKHIFFAAENDPHGAHGLASELLGKALQNMPALDVTLWGYRGAYTEWPLREAEHLSIVPFQKVLMDLKVRSIRHHVSQLNPMYPSFDPREFYQRAIDRNRAFAQQVTKVIGRPLAEMHSNGQHKAQFAEAFRRYTQEEFIQRNAG